MPEPKIVPLEVEAFRQHGGVFRDLKRRVLSIDFAEAEFEAKDSLPARPSPEGWERRIADLWLITHLAIKLYGYVFSGFRWWFNFMRLVAFVIFLLPGFSQMIAFYFFSPRLIRSVPYGTKPRNRLDVYLPRYKWRKAGPCPVVIYVTGGAWTIGYKAWGALFGRRLSQRGVLFFCLDYRNFPQGSCLDMLEDCNTGVAWVLDHCQSYGGDPNNVFIVGQSAGGHLMSVSLLGQVWQRQNGGSVVGGTPSWDVTRVKGFVGVSGAYNLLTLADHMHRRGLYKHMLASIMQGPEGQPWLEELSPTCLAKKLDPGVAAGVPPVLLLHGTADNSVPIDNAEEYAAALEGAGIKCRLKKYPGKTHTQPIVEDPMRGGQDQLMDEVLSLVRGEKCSNKQFPMLPSMLIDAATWVCPF